MAWLAGLLVGAALEGDGLGDAEVLPVPVGDGEGLGDELGDGEVLGFGLGELLELADGEGLADPDVLQLGDGDADGPTPELVTPPGLVREPDLPDGAAPPPLSPAPTW
jgi:hypothetical protein